MCCVSLFGLAEASIVLARRVDGVNVYPTSLACGGAPPKPNGPCWITNDELANRPTGLCSLLLGVLRLQTLFSSGCAV